MLFLCHTLPYPPDSGIAIRSFHVLRLLARAFDVTALCFSRRKGGTVPQQDLAQRVAALRRLVEVEAFPVPQEHSAWRLAWDHLRSAGLNRAYTAFAYDSPTVANRIRELLRTRRFALIHVDSIALSRYLPLFDGVPVVCGHHNVESELLQRRARVEGPFWRRAYVRHQARLLAREERHWGARCALNIAVSEEDRLTLQRLVPGISCAVVPNGVDIETFRPSLDDDERGLVFAGELTWFPNRDALQYFCDEILPRIRSAHGVTPVHWVGRASEALRREYRDRHAVELTGYVADVRPYVRAAACYVVPLRVGGGTRLKILDAWAMGKAVVSTSVGCEGLDAQDGRNILVRDDPESFAQAVCAVLRDALLRRRLGAEGRRTVERRYSWERIGESMLRLYGSLLRTRRVLTSTALTSLLPFVLRAPVASAPEHYYVSPAGSDTNPCTAAAPCRTMHRVGRLLGPGDTAHFASGEYSWPAQGVSASGTATARVTYISDEQWGARISGGCPIMRNTGDYVNISGFAMTGTCANGLVQDGNYGRITGNLVYDLPGTTGYAGILVDCCAYTLTGNQVIGNVVDNIGPLGSSNTVHGIYVAGPHSRIENNIVTRAAAACIQTYHGPHHLVIANNVVAHCGRYGIKVSADAARGVKNDYTTVNNNIVVNVDGNRQYNYGIMEYPSTGSHNVYNNNIVYNNSGGNLRLIGGEESGTIVLTREQFGALFVNYTGDRHGDYRLRGGAVGIDAGTTRCAAGVTGCVPATDFAGVPRPQGAALDIGAFER